MTPAPLHAVGVSHKGAPLPVRERFAFAPAAAERVLAAPGGERFLLVTCNRTELYGLEPGERLVERLLEAAGGAADASALFTLEDGHAARHLFSVAAGLDSMVVGEPQILGQVKHAMAAARGAGSLGPVLDELSRRALMVGRRVRRETELGSGLPSIPKVAVGVAHLVLGDLAGHRLLVIGSGKLGDLTARMLQRAGATGVVVTNRTPEAAAALAAAIGGRAEPFDALDRLLAESDIVISCTASQEPVLTRARVAAALAARNGRAPLVIVDIAVPRDVEADVRTLDGARLYDLDDLREWSSSAVSPETIAAAETIVEHETRDFLAWREGRRAIPTIRALQERADGILDAELRRLPAEEAEAMRAFGRRVVAKLLHHPMSRLRDRAATDGDGYLAVARDLFALESGNGDPGGNGDRDRG
jgi:glutamyl-tRNA reductase